MSTNSKETVPPKERLVGLTELLKEAARGWDDVEAGELMSVSELKARYRGFKVHSR